MDKAKQQGAEKKQRATGWPKSDFSVSKKNPTKSRGYVEERKERG